MRPSISIVLVLLTAGTIAHAERYNVRDAQGRFAKIQPKTTSVVKVSTALVPMKGERLALPAPKQVLALPAPKQMLALPAPKQMLALPAPAAEPIAVASAAKVKPSLLSRAGQAFAKLHPITWMKNNLTVSTEASDHMVAAKALRKEGRLGEAAAQLTSAPAPRGFAERIFLGHAESKVRSAAMTTMKYAARAGQSHEAHQAFKALVAMQGTMGRFAAWRANRAVAKTAKLSISSAHTAGKHGDLDSAQHSVMLAGFLGASDRQMDKANARLVKDATKQAKLAAKHGDVDATVSALEHAGNVPGSKMTQEESDAIYTKAFSKSMAQRVKEATKAYKMGDKQTAALAMAQVKSMRTDSGIELTGRVHRDEVRMNALLGSHVDEALAELNAPTDYAQRAATSHFGADTTVTN